MTEPRYWAFISYSHHDAAVAARLQRDIEGYPVPRRLVGRETAVGALPARLKPVYRDRDELRAGVDLAEPIRQALSQSRWLIVVCSPDSARSAWVQQEIVQFKRLHGAQGERRVLALIVAGEPGASALPGRESEECFPLPLRFALDALGQPVGTPLEPIAADLREQGDGRRRATLKLLAGMMDLALDDLVRRDLRRRLRWVSALALGSLAGMAVLGALAYSATQARNEARVQRAQAEDLIEFMLGDLRKKLEPVGRLDVLDAVGAKALAHYDGQPTQVLDAASLGRRSRAQHLIGEMREKSGQFAEAQLAFGSAAATTAALLAREPHDPQRIFDHSQSVFWVGYAAWLRGVVPDAEESFQDYRRLAQQLVAIDPKRADWQVELAYAAVNLGVVLGETGRAEPALKEFGVARAIFETLLPTQPELRYDLAQAYGWMAKAFDQRGEYASAAEIQRTKKAMFEAMPDAQRNSQARHGILVAEIQLAVLELRQGRSAAALEHARTAIDIGQALVARDPSNLVMLDELTRCRMVYAQTLGADGRVDEARRAIEPVQADLARLLGAGDTSPERQVDLQGEWLALKARLGVAGQATELITELDAYLRSLPRYAALLEQRPRLAYQASSAQYELGRLLRGAGDGAAAATHWQAALARLTRLGETVGLRGLALEAAIHLALGQRAQAQDLLERLQHSPYRHPEVAELRHRLAPAAGAAPQPHFARNPP